MATLIQAGNINKFPKDFKYPEMPDHGTVVEFKILQEPAKEIIDGRRIQEVYPRMYTFDPKGVCAVNSGDRIVTVPIQIVTEVDEKDKVLSVHKIRFDAERDKGVFRLTIGKSPAEDMAYIYLFLNSQRKRSLDEEDEWPVAHGTEPKYILVDKVADARKRKEQRDNTHAAYIHSTGIKDSELREYAILFGQDDRADVIVMRDAIEQYAQAFPKDYLAKVNDEDRVYRSLFKRALSAKAIYQEGVDIKWTESGSKVFVMRTDDSTQAADEFVHFIKTNDIAKNMVSLMKTKLDSADGVKKGGRPKATDKTAE